MSKSAIPELINTNTADIAEKFVTARKSGISFETYPGVLPKTLQEAYAVQDEAINLWGDDIAGWKVGRIPDHLIETLGQHRLAGPIFRRLTWQADDQSVTSTPIIKGGFAAVEAEFLLILGQDAPAEKLNWTREEAAQLVASANIGIEIAASPYPNINVDGPTCVVSDFGNNAGVIVGPEIQGWKDRDFSEWACSTTINGQLVGTGTANDIPNGPFESLRFLLELSASRGRPLKKGCVVSTGAVTGIHDIEIGDASEVSFGKDGTLHHKATG